MHSGKIKTLFIINPILEKKAGNNVFRVIHEDLDTDRFDHRILYSEYPGHARQLAKENAGEYDVVIAGGGDGTVNEVAYGLVHSQTVLGLLPMGSGKGLARSLRVPLNLRKAIAIINRFMVVRIDTGRVNHHRFVNIAGIGFAAEIAHAYAGSRRRGFIPYAMHVTKKMPGYPSLNAGITIGEREFRDRFFDISFANATQWGYGARISPTSKPDDGLLDICILREFPKILIPGLLTRLFTGTIHRSGYMQTIPAQQAGISGGGPFKGHVDGEPVEFTAQFEVSVEPGSLQVICVPQH